MFDRPPAAPPTDAGTGTGLDDSVRRLCAVYDGLIADGRPLSPQQAAELNAMAGIFDIDAHRPADQVWSDVRHAVTAPVPQEARAFVDADPVTILLVEDDPDMAADITEILTEAGHAVVGPFHNAEAAEVATGLHLIDLALLDINLSGTTTGVDLARTLKQRWGVRTLFLSGDIETAVRHADLAEAILIKPYTGGQILAAIARLADPRSHRPG